MTPDHSLKTTRSSHSAQYRRHQTYSDALKNSLSPRTIPDRNSLSPSVANIQSTEEFRERSGSVVEWVTRDRRAAGSSLTDVMALWSLSKTHLS